jgi:hypothetical protein
MATKNITGNAGTLSLLGNNTVNVSGLTEANIGSPTIGSTTTINLEPGSELVGSIRDAAGTLNLTGQGMWDNTATKAAPSTIDSGTIGVPVVGTGEIADASYFADRGKLTFLHGVTVGSGQTLLDEGTQFLGTFAGDVEVQSPLLFHAAVQLGFGQLELDGLNGTSASLHNDLLSIFNGMTPVDTLRLTLGGNVGPVDPLVVSQTAGGITIHADGSAYTGGGQTLPLHG